MSCGDLMSLIAEAHKLQLDISCYCHLQDALTVQNFTTSEEAFAAEDLCNAFRSGDADKITALIKPTSLYMQLDMMISRLAKKLPIGDLRTIAAELEVAAARQADLQQSSTIQQCFNDEDLS
jgi:hypothetical protein